jgi:hypothetical protein
MIKKVTSINRVGMLTGITKRNVIIILAGTINIIKLSIITAIDIVTGKFIKSADRHPDRHAPRERNIIVFKVNEPDYKFAVVVKNRR